MHATLTTERLILRPLALEDAARIQEIFPHWEVTQYLADVIPWPYPEDGAAAFVNFMLPKLEQSERFCWAITLKGVLIGVIELNPGGEHHRGFWLGVDYQRKGYMTEASEAVNAFAFEELGMAELRLINAVPNRGSSRIKANSGAKLIGVNTDHGYIGGQFESEEWILTREDWLARRSQSAG